MTKPLHYELQMKLVQFTENSERKDKLLTPMDRLHIQLPSSVSEELSGSQEDVFSEDSDTTAPEGGSTSVPDGSSGA
jgi:hypothetical protein